MHLELTTGRGMSEAAPRPAGSATTWAVQRPPRRAAPPLPSGDVALEPPPAIPQPTGARWQQLLTVLPMLAGTMATALMFGGRDGASPYTYVVGGIFGLSTLGMLAMNWTGAAGPRKAELMRARRDYLRYVSGQRTRVRATIAAQRDAMLYRHPEPATLWCYTSGARLWERRPADADFGAVRIGTGPQTLATPLVAPVIDPAADLEPVTAGALRRFLDAYASVPDLPVAVAVRSFAHVVLAGTDGAARRLARSVVGQLATFHAPDDLVVAACVAPELRREWEWLKWLPHALHPTVADALGPGRLVAGSLTELEQMLGPILGQRPRRAGGSAAAVPHVVVLLDGGDARGSTHVLADGGLDGLTVVHIGPSSPAPPVDRDTLVLTVDADGTLHSATVEERIEVGRADGLGLAEAEALARTLAPLRLSGAGGPAAPLSTDHALTDLLGIADASTADVATLWATRPPRETLRIPIGTSPDGRPVRLDIKEAAQDGMGPHGLVVGATGSGKSELLRTIVLGLAATHSSDALNLVLVDFKGGATFASLDRLPHTSALITNLADELPLVDRMNDALSGELTRRQELLRRSGNVASIRDYDRARAAGADLPPLPVLLVVCDEFTELLTAKPDFIDLFLQIGRVGRSLGVHLLLATQRLEEGRLRGLESNLAYKIALRTFSPGESRIAIGVADAAELPSSPGHGYLRVGTEPLRRFKAAYVSGPYRRPVASGAPALRVRQYTTYPAPVGEAAPQAVTGPATTTMLEVLVGRLAGHGPAAHRVWLPPLDRPAALGEVLGAVVADAARGVTVAEASLRGGLRVAVAEVDKPFEQRRDVLWFDLAGAAGHVAVVGGPLSGKSTALRTVVTALALTHTPREVQVYCLDFGGGTLAQLRDLPHVGGVAGRLDGAVVRRTVGEVATLLADRERRFSERGVDSVAAFRRLRRPSDLDATVALPEDGYGDVFLVVDGWATLRHEYEDLEPVVVDIATRGLSYGIHVVASATRWADFRAGVKDLFGSRLELRLGDPSDSAVDRRAAANVPSATPGRGLSADGLHVLVATPEIAGHDAASVVKAIASAWAGPPAPRVRMLPSLLPYAALLTTAEDGPALPLGHGLELPLGVAEADLRPVLIDFAADAHLIAYGDAECGKSTLLRSIAESITRRFAPEQARIVLVDYRRSLLGAVTTDHLIGYGTTAENTAPLIESVASYMERRRPGPDVTPEQLRGRSWWTGPECFVLVDDYDLVATAAASPLLPLLEYLSQARDVGLHLVVTRRAGGAARALYEPILQRLRELGGPGLVMSGERDEGALVGGVRAGPQPPGRGWLVTRRDGARLVQLAHVPS
jgi:S-DNA-T family DNA segregation ATPase FtsK/SpoIIIE